MSPIDPIKQPTGIQRADLSRSTAEVVPSKSKSFSTSDRLDLRSSMALETEKKVEAEFTARKAEILKQQLAGDYDPDQAMDYISQRLANGAVEHR